MCRILFRLIASAVVLLFALPLIAGEGRMPIYQQTTINSPGKYIVTRNIGAGAAGPVIDILANDVDIDLNGFVLRGGAGPVIHCPGFNNITIRNGTLLQGQDGIVIIAGADEQMGKKVVIEDVKIMYPEVRGIFLDAMTDFALRRNNVVGSGAEGVFIDVAAVMNPDPVHGTIEDNQIEQCGGGITVRDGSSVAIIGNRLERINVSAGPPSQGGIIYDYAEGGLIAQNTVLDVTNGSGIFLGDSSGCKIYNNVVRRAEFNGIHLGGFSLDNLVLDNVVTQAGQDGLRVEGDRNHSERNVLNANGQSGTGWGLHFSVAWGFGNDNTFGRNTARGNIGPAPACPAGPGPNPPTNDFCDEGFGNDSFFDNYMPNFF